ncbi:MAG: hypothetical protein FWG14_03995 [Peptococcaceae bacterium]|nr:hypothetical protein [Peptococcaceae bacterium]
MMALFSYIGLLFLIPLLAAPNSRFARFHVNQGVVLCIVGVGFGIVFGVLYGILTAILILTSLRWILYILWILCLIPLAFVILGIVNCVSGKAKELPLIGGIKIIK